jgi:hypothetical protein
MRAKKLIEGATYEPHELKVLGEAFDEAWASISSDFEGDPQAVEDARYRLAKIMLVIPTNEMCTVEQIKASSIQLMALINRSPAIRAS